MLLKEKVALIVGIKNDIGSTTAEIMAQEGAKVVVAERNSFSGQTLVSKILAAGGEAIYQEMDVTLNRCQKALITRVIGEYGRLDIAFNNVSVDGDFFPLAQQSEDMVAGIIDVNFNGMWLSLKYQIEQMLKNGGGAIVNNVSNFKADGSIGCSIYSATKSAVATMSQVAALEYARNNIRINTITPGLLGRSLHDSDNGEISPNNSAIIPVNRYATPQEIAEAIVWLCSDKASYLTGHNLPVDGGLSALRVS
ncbi:MAG: SDR family oxidoreductase [Pleurocapsa sp. MO_192.B19]|nr:SDR family oxidoreductase [Pleurocapsa sp. MO_192.B19]